MKRIIAVILTILLLVTGCSVKRKETTEEQTHNPANLLDIRTLDWTTAAPEFSGLDDPDLLGFVEDEVYSQLISEIGTADYIIERVDAVYLSKEYLEETEYNSRENIFFGYSLSEVDSLFGNKKYVFTLGEDDTTIVQELEVVPEVDYYNRIIKNILIGSGVILVCVVLSSVTAGSAPAVATILAISAKEAAKMAVCGALISGVSAGIAKGYQTEDFNESIKAAALAGSEGFKWGAISGAVFGGAKEALVLHHATASGLTMNEVAMIQQESGYPLELIREFHSMKEYAVFKRAGLIPYPVNGRTMLIRTDIDINQLDEFGVSNLERMLNGKAPYAPNGRIIELHHIGQKQAGTLAMLTDKEHDNPVLHWFTNTSSEIDRPGFDKERREIWKAMGHLLSGIY